MTVDRVVRTTLIQTIVASGHVETPFRVDIGSQITGTVADVPVQEGQRVTKDQVLIRLDARELASALEQAAAVDAQAEAQLRQIEELTLPPARATLRKAQATQLNAQQSFNRTAELARSGFATRVALDEAQKNLEVTRTQVRTAELQVATTSAGGSDRMLAETQLTQARAARAVATTRLSYATITAPRAGVLISHDVEQGSVVQPGKALLVLAPDGAMQLVAQIDERNLGKLAVGQAALASAYAYAAERLAQQIAATNEVQADNWIKTNAQFFIAVQAQQTSNTLIRVFVGLSVAFGIVAVLVVSVIQRSKDIGILRAIGASRGQVMGVFLIQGGVLGFAGSLAGATFGVGGLLYWHGLVRQAEGSELFPLTLERQLFVATAMLATLTGVLAAMAPALRAARLDPVMAIRG